MGKGFEIQGLDQLPVWSIEQVNRFNVFLASALCSVHCHLEAGNRSMIWRKQRGKHRALTLFHYGCGKRGGDGLR
jgi:hypothetical protein